MIVEVIVGIIKIPLVAGIVSGLIVGIILYVFYTKSSTTRKRANIENNAKIKAGSIKGIIDGINEFKLSLEGMGELILRIAGTASADITENPNLTGEAVMIKTVSSVQNHTKETSQKIEHFISLLKNDMEINGENKSIKKEITNIENIYKEMKEAFKSEKKISKMEHSDVHKIVVRILQKYTPDKEVYKTIDDSIEIILTIYAAKLN